MKRKKTFDYRAAALALAARIPRDRLHPAVLRWAEASSTRVQWYIAFSGGADSLALLLLLWAHWPERRGRMRALHFDHRLRGAASRADALFCRKVSKTLGVDFVAKAWRGVRASASEAEARAARMAFFERQGRVLWLGHQQDDVAESLLMRLARGSGAGGLAAPRPVQPMPGNRIRLRPLLSIQKAEVVSALCAVKIPWREDATNAGAAYFRNRIRHTVMPAWIRAAERDAVAGAARSRELLEEDDAALEAWVAGEPTRSPGGGLLLSTLTGKPRGFIRRALHRWLAESRRGNHLSRQAFDALLVALERGQPTRHSLGREGFAVITSRELRFEAVRNARSRFHRRTN